MRQIVFFLIGALLLVALLGLLLAQYLNISNPLKQSLLLLAAACLATYGAELLPKNRCKRPIVKRKLLLGASVALFGGAVLLLLNAFECHTILAWLGGHWGHGAGFAMAVAPLAVAEGELEEFRSTLSGLKSVGNKITDASHRLDLLERENNTLKADLNRLKKAGLAGGGSGVRWIGDVPFVSDDCATALTSVMVLECAKFDGGRGLEGMVKSGETRDRVLALARQTLAIETRAALTGTEIPLPTVYASQVMELVFKYGQARQFATQFPLGAGTVKLPRLKAGEDDFGYFGVGTAGMSQSITEKKVTAELVTFTANKAGGMIRIPYEIDSDTFIPIGQFLARYIARQLAKLEDKTLFLADGTATYANQTGVGPYCVANPSFLLQLAAGKTKPSDATLADFRNLRAKVGAAVLQGGFDAAYYLNPTWEPALRAFNTYPSFIVFDSTNGKPTLDGWPVRWIGVSQAYATTAVPSAFCAFFGALSYWFLGERGQPRIEVSRDVFFATDEIAMRALERIDVECLGVDSMAALQTAAS